MDRVTIVRAWNRVRRRTARRRRDADPLLPWIVGTGIFSAIVVVVLALMPGPALPEKAFYGVAAQIFPILLLALVVEARMDEFWRQRPRSVRWSLFGSLGFGELLALVAASGTFAATPGAYDRWAGKEFLWLAFFEPADVGRVRANGILVAWTPPASLFFATVVGIALVWGFLGLLAVATVGDPRVSAPIRAGSVETEQRRGGRPDVWV
jgi:hypothetical protein